MRRWVDIATLRPNNWYVSRVKLDHVLEAWREGTQSRLPPVLVTHIDGEPSLIDGHARTLAAFLEGAQVILAEVEALDRIEGSAALYVHIHRRGPAIGVAHVSDLVDRIVDSDTHRKLWIGYCERWLASQRPRAER